MECTIKSLSGFKLGSSDGTIGNIFSLYFDDETWAVRYLVIKTGNWFSEKKVLIDPQALLVPDWENKIFPVNLTKEQIKNSPDIDTEKPVSQQQEIAMYGHYAWERYGGSGFYAGGTAGIMNMTPVIDEAIITEIDPGKDEDYDPHLRSTENIEGYHIHSTDGGIGHVYDFIVDTGSWKITAIIMDTHNWIGGHKVNIPIRHVTEIQWANYEVLLDVSTAFIKDEPVFHEEGFNKPS